MRSDMFVQNFDITDNEYFKNEHVVISKVRRKICIDYKETLVMREIEKSKIKDLNYFDRLLKVKIANVLSPIEVIKDQGKQKNQIILVYRDFVLSRVTKSNISNLSPFVLKKMILQLAITLKELNRKKIYWNLNALSQLFLINECAFISSIDLSFNDFNQEGNNFINFRAFIMNNFIYYHPNLKDFFVGNTFEEVLQFGMEQLGYNKNLKQQHFPQYHNMVSLFFQMEEVTCLTGGPIEPFFIEFKTPEIFKLIHPTITTKTVYKALNFEADKAQMLINQEREIETTELLDGCPQIAIGFCYLQIFDQTFFFLNRFVMTLLEGLDKMSKMGYTINENRKLVYKICFQIAKGLDKMHSYGIMHRNLCPQNIYMDDQDLFQSNYCIAEFDKAKQTIQQQHGTNSMIKLCGATQANCSASIGYLPPEDAQQYSIKTDLFQFGIIALQIANQGKYFGNTIYGLDREEFDQQYSQQVITAKLQQFGYDEKLIQQISNCIKLSPAQRPNTSELLKIIYQLYLSSRIRIIKQEIIQNPQQQ